MLYNCTAEIFRTQNNFHNRLSLAENAGAGPVARAREIDKAHWFAGPQPIPVIEP